MKDKQIDKAKVLQYIEEHGSISRAEAMNRIGVYCLPERVRDLRKSGIDIKGERTFEINSAGQKKYFTRYSL